MQTVKMYYDILQAKYDMEAYISSGWRVHTCTLSTHMARYTSKEIILVVYEK